LPIGATTGECLTFRGNPQGSDPLCMSSKAVAKPAGLLVPHVNGFVGTGTTRVPISRGYEADRPDRFANHVRRRQQTEKWPGSSPFCCCPGSVRVQKRLENHLNGFRRSEVVGPASVIFEPIRFGGQVIDPILRLKSGPIARVRQGRERLTLPSHCMSLDNNAPRRVGSVRDSLAAFFVLANRRFWAGSAGVGATGDGDGGEACHRCEAQHRLRPVGGWSEDYVEVSAIVLCGSPLACNCRDKPWAL
jgi:hypothetical protein